MFYSCGSQVSLFSKEVSKLNVELLEKYVKKNKLYIKLKVKNKSEKEFGLKGLINISFKSEITLVNGEKTNASLYGQTIFGQLNSGEVVLENLYIPNPNPTPDIKELEPKIVTLFFYGQTPKKMPEQIKQMEINWSN